MPGSGWRAGGRAADYAALVELELIVWYEPQRVTHDEAAAKASYEAHPAVADFCAEVGDLVVGGDRASHARLSVKEGAVARVRYAASKHRLVCYDPQWRAVLNPPLLRRPGAWELSFCVGHSIDDPAPAHLERALRGLTPDNWFAALEDGDEHYVQAALSEPGHLLEFREGSAEKHWQTRVSDVDALIGAFVAQAGGDSTWRDGFEWTAL